jgi:MSHA biogenesis protein MshE
MVLVTGPTGSGKTTSLYGALKELNKPAHKIITVEDPIEYRLPGINQVQVNAKIDLSFARVLRSVLRQDPDIILVGEMRDQETAEIGLRAAMTGHLVLSTLHTNDAISTIARLFDMGAAPFLVAASLRGILAQRLVRRICESCAEPTTLEPGQRALVLAELGEHAQDVQFRRGRGCTYCNNTGYQGRVGVYELVEMDDSLLAPLHVGDALAFAEAARHQPGYQSLKRNALELAARGVTTVDQVMRVTFGLEE